MRYFWNLLTVVLLCYAFMGEVSAQQITIDLKKVDSQLAAKILDAQKNLEQVATPAVSVSQAKEWATIGEDVAKAIAATAKALSLEVNDFIKTPVGKFAAFLVFWYIIGGQLWSIVGGSIAWLVLGVVIWRSFSIFHRPRQVLKTVAADGIKTYQTATYEFGSKEAKTFSASAHAAAFIVLSAVMLIIIL